MSVNKNKKYRLRKRIFLSEDYDSFTCVIASVEKSKRGDASPKSDESTGIPKLIVESSYAWVNIDFALDLPEQVKESRAKIKALQKLLRSFRKAFEKEAEARKKRSYEHIKDKIVTRR